MNAKVIENILVIGDLHLPFEKPGYFEFCIDKYKAFNCNKVVFIGDILDSHFGSYHEVDSDAWGGKYELEQAIRHAQRWIEAFPVADVCIGNHDAIVSRKAQTGGIPQLWIKSFSEVLGAPGWTFKTDFIYNEVRYSHGHKSGKARTGHKRDMHSLVTGHYHTDLYVDYNFGIGKATFGMAVGAGADDATYNVNYAQGGKKCAFGLGVVLNNGKHPIAVPMNMEVYKDCTIPNNFSRANSKKEREEYKQIKKSNKYRSIIHEETGKVYESQKEVQDILGVSKGYLSKMLNGKMNNHTGYKYL